MDKIIASDHPDCAGGIVWSPCELRWINSKIEQQAERIRELEEEDTAVHLLKDATITMQGESIDALEDERDELAALCEKLREALYKLCESADDSDDCQYGTLSTSFVRDIAQEALALPDLATPPSIWRRCWPRT